MGAVQRRPGQRRLHHARRRREVDEGRPAACRSRRSARSTSRSRRRTRKRMYALIQTADQGSLWRSDDAGATWKVVSWDRSLIGRAGYYIRMVVNPQNPDDVFITSSSFHRSQDGGKTFSGNGGASSPSRRGRRAAATATTSGSIRRIRSATSLTDDGGASINTQAGHRPRVAAERADVSRARRQPRALLDLQQPPGRRHDARADDDARRQTGNGVPAGGQRHADAGRGTRRGARPGGGGGGGRTRRAARRGARRSAARRCRRRRRAARATPATAWQPNIGGCESGFTIPDPTDAEHRLRVAATATR